MSCLKSGPVREVSRLGGIAVPLLFLVEVPCDVSDREKKEGGTTEIRERERKKRKTEEKRDTL